MQIDQSSRGLTVDNLRSMTITAQARKVEQDGIREAVYGEMLPSQGELDRRFADLMIHVNDAFLNAARPQLSSFQHLLSAISKGPFDESLRRDKKRIDAGIDEALENGESLPSIIQSLKSLGDECFDPDGLRRTSLAVLANKIAEGRLKVPAQHEAFYAPLLLRELRKIEGLHISESYERYYYTNNSAGAFLDYLDITIVASWAKQTT